MYPDNYVLATLRRVGVPPLWLEDALQEVRIREWRSDETGKGLLHRWAIDAVRRLPDHHRDGTSDAAPDSLEEVLAARVPMPLTPRYPSDELIDAELAINAQPLIRRKAFALLAAGENATTVGQRLHLSTSRIVAFRRMLREVAG